MYLDKCLIWVESFHEVLCEQDKEAARIILKNHLADAEGMIKHTAGSPEYQAMFEADVTKINNALKLISQEAKTNER